MSIFTYLYRFKEPVVVTRETLVDHLDLVRSFQDGDITEFFPALDLADQHVLQKMCRNIWIHYGRAHYEAALQMIRGENIDSTLDALDALIGATTIKARRPIQFIPEDTRNQYVFDLRMARTSFPLYQDSDHCTYIVTADTSYYPALEASLCIPERLTKVGDTAAPLCIFDATVDNSVADILRYIVLAATSPSCLERRAKIVYITDTVRTDLINFSTSPDGLAILNGLEVSYDKAYSGPSK